MNDYDDIEDTELDDQERAELGIDNSRWCPYCDKAVTNCARECLMPDECYFDEDDVDPEQELDFNG